MKVAWRRKNIGEVETSMEYKDRKTRERIEDWIGKKLHGQFKRETEELSNESWMLDRSRGIKGDGRTHLCSSRPGNKNKH